VLADRDQWPDLHVFETGIDDAFTELAKLGHERSPDGDSPASERPRDGYPGPQGASETG
jgi:hypothetical protein